MPELRTPDALRFALTTVGLLVAVALLWMLRDVLMLVGFAAVLAFALEPLVVILQRIRVQKRSLPRPTAALLVVLLAGSVFIWALVVFMPQVMREAGGFVERAPASLERLLASLRIWADGRGLGSALGPLGGATPMTAHELMVSVVAPVLRAVGGLIDFGQIVGVVLVPVLSFYLLAERGAVETSALQFVPEDMRTRVQKALGAIHRALRSYVRGQAVVCALMGGITGIALAFIGLPGAILLGTIVALAEIVPIVGFWSASIAIVLAGWSTANPATALYGWLAYVGINQIVSLLIVPRVMSRHLKLHPFVVMVSILAGGSLLGAAGAILALPLAAALQSLVAEFAPRPSRRFNDRPATP